MKIVAIHKYGTLTFRDDGGTHIDGWHVEFAEQRYQPTIDELGLMLFEFLATNTRERMLARAHLEKQTALQ